MAKATDSKIDALALAVAQGVSVSWAARDLHVNISTATNWSQHPSFWPRVGAHRKAIVDQSIGKLAEATASAVQKLLGLLNEGYPPEVQFKAARELLLAYVAMVNATELSDRLDAIEQRLAASGAGGPT